MSTNDVHGARLDKQSECSLALCLLGLMRAPGAHASDGHADDAHILQQRERDGKALNDNDIQTYPSLPLFRENLSLLVKDRDARCQKAMPCAGPMSAASLAGPARPCQVLLPAMPESRFYSKSQQ